MRIRGFELRSGHSDSALNHWLTSATHLVTPPSPCHCYVHHARTGDEHHVRAVDRQRVRPALCAADIRQNLYLDPSIRVRLTSKTDGRLLTTGLGPYPHHGDHGACRHPASLCDGADDGRAAEAGQSSCARAVSLCLRVGGLGGRRYDGRIRHVQSPLFLTSSI